MAKKQSRKGSAQLPIGSSLWATARVKEEEAQKASHDPYATKITIENGLPPPRPSQLLPEQGGKI